MLIWSVSISSVIEKVGVETFTPSVQDAASHAAQASTVLSAVTRATLQEAANAARVLQWEPREYMATQHWELPCVFQTIHPEPKLGLGIAPLAPSSIAETICVAGNWSQSLAAALRDIAADPSSRQSLVTVANGQLLDWLLETACSEHQQVQSEREPQQQRASTDTALGAIHHLLKDGRG